MLIVDLDLLHDIQLLADTILHEKRLAVGSFAQDFDSIILLHVTVATAVTVRGVTLATAVLAIGTVIVAVAGVTAKMNIVVNVVYRKRCTIKVVRNKELKVVSLHQGTRKTGRWYAR